MQSFNIMADTDMLEDSRIVINENDLTCLSSSSGTSFPALELEVGRLCFRTDQLKLYILSQFLYEQPVWLLIADLIDVAVTTSVMNNTLSKIGHTHIKADITDWKHSHLGEEIGIATKDKLGVVSAGNNISINSKGEISVDLSSYSKVNSATPKDGDIKCVDGRIYVFCNGKLNQIYPVIYQQNS